MQKSFIININNKIAQYKGKVMSIKTILMSSQY